MGKYHTIRVSADTMRKLKGLKTALAQQIVQSQYATAIVTFDDCIRCLIDGSGFWKKEKVEEKSK